MLKPLILAAAVFASAAPTLVHAQFVDEAVQKRGSEIAVKLKAWLEPQLPTKSDPWVMSEDGRIFATILTLPADTDLLALGKQAGSDAKEVSAAMEAWATKLNREYMAKATALVAEAKADPDFNPETDCRLLVSFRGPGAKDQPEGAISYHFTGSHLGARRNFDTGKVLVPAKGEPIGGEIEVVISPSRTDWSPKETITGKISITNTGKTRVYLSAWHYDSVNVTDPAGKKPQEFFMMGNIDPAANAAMYRFVKPGEKLEETFTVYTDRLHSMEHGYYLSEGDWLLGYGPLDLDNVKVVCAPTTIHVTAKPGEYTGPRILEAYGAGENIILAREDDSYEVLNASSGARLGSKPRDTGADPNRSWLGWGCVFSPDGRLMAFCKDRESPISIVALYGDPPPVTTIAAPKDLEVGPGGFMARKFLADGKDLVCVSNNAMVIVGLHDGVTKRSSTLPEMWPDLSPDGSHGAALEGLMMRIVGYRGDDKYSIRLLDTTGGEAPRKVEVKGHGTCPSVHAGLKGVYLTDEFEDAVVYMPYTIANGEKPFREFPAGGPSDFVGESSDGSLVAFSWPAWDRGGTPDPTTIGVYRVADGQRVSLIKCDAPSTAVLLSNPPRIGVLRHRLLGDRWVARSVMEEAAEVFDIICPYSDLPSLHQNSVDVVNQVKVLGHACHAESQACKDRVCLALSRAL